MSDPGASGVRLEVSPWREAALDLQGEVVFAVGDVHGCARQLDALLDTAAELLAATKRSQRLVFLGDLINRGPDTLGVLRRWAAPEPVRGVPEVTRLMGNHEQLLLIAAAGGVQAGQAWAMSIARGGDRFLAELRRAAGQPTAAMSAALLRAGLDERSLDLFQHGLRTFVQVGKVLFVHAGLDPETDEDSFLALPATELPEGEHHWAWIEGRFLGWRGGFGGRIVVHGHVPPAKHRTLTGQDDPHLLVHDRLGLDGGSAVTGVVTGAQIEDGRYRVVRAVADAA